MNIVDASWLKEADRMGCVTGTYVDEEILTEKGKVDYRKFKPALFQFPTYEYLVTGDVLGPCMKMNEQ